MAMKYIKQRSEIDCAVAALAMACGVDYETVARDLDIGTEGANDGLIKDWLFRHDWAWQEVTAQLWKRGKFFPQLNWPPSPFATTHICFLEATKTWHYCAMDFDGRVYDPWKEERHSLSHPDYKRIGSVIGLFKIRRRRDEVSG